MAVVVDIVGISGLSVTLMVPVAVPDAIPVDMDGSLGSLVDGITDAVDVSVIIGTAVVAAGSVYIELIHAVISAELYRFGLDPFKHGVQNELLLCPSCIACLPVTCIVKLCCIESGSGELMFSPPW